MFLFLSTLTLSTSSLLTANFCYKNIMVNQMNSSSETINSQPNIFNSSENTSTSSNHIRTDTGSSTGDNNLNNIYKSISKLQ